MTDLTTRYLGFTLRAPLVASPSPLTSTLDGLHRLEAAGVGAVVLPSLVEEEVEAVQTRLGERTICTGFYSYGELCPSAFVASCELHNQTMTLTVLSEDA